MKKIILPLLLLFTLKATAQLEFYSTDGKNRLTEAQADTLLEEAKEKYLKLMGKKTYVSFVIVDIFTRGDTSIKKLTFNVSNKKPKSKFKMNPDLAYLGKEFPDFDLKTLSGDKFEANNLKGKPTLINFWFTSCAPCIDEMSILNGIQEKLQNKVNFLAITFQDQKSVKKFLKKHEFQFFHLVDGQDLIDELGIKSFPKSIFLDENNTIRYFKGGLPYSMDDKGEMIIQDDGKFLEYLEDLLKK